METGPLDVQPLRTLAPMFPSSYGSSTFSVPGGSPFIYLSPSRPNPPPFPAPTQSPPTRQPVSPSPVSDNDDHVDTNATQFNTPTHSSTGSKKLPRRAPGANHVLVPSCQDPRESVEIVLMTFDALRRRLVQQDETNWGGKDGTRRPDLKAGTVLMANSLRANTGKRMGPVAGVDIGDIFYLRMELCLVGLHAPSMGGIDYMTSAFGTGNDTVAISVVSAGGYENEDGDADVLVYSGQGGNANVDQKLERGNLALERSLHRGIDVRVIRSTRDYSFPTGKIYVYDGLYKVHESWVEKAKSGFNVFKYKLLRKPEQPEGIAVWKRIQKWKADPAARGLVLPDVSSGVENLPVCVVNEVDDERGPSRFEYVGRATRRRPSNSTEPSNGCECRAVCLPGDNGCSCGRANGGNLPYSSSGFLVSRKPLIYECGVSCRCSISCRNRLTQKGVAVQFEVFKTRNKGWGLRSLDPIRAGTFICEYAGEIVDLGDEDAEEDEYIFRVAGADDKALKWNYGPELLGEPSVDNSSESFGPLPFVVSAKRMGNVSRFVNHSCSPNVFCQPVLHDRSQEGYPHVAFFAIKHIPPMTELTYDYGLGGGDGIQMPKQCLCGSPKCRGRFG